MNRQGNWTRDESDIGTDTAWISEMSKYTKAMKC